MIDEKLRHFENVYQICEAFIEERLKHYVIRKEYQMNQYKQRLLLLRNKYKYIQETLDDKVDLRKKNYTQINELLTTRKYDKIDDSYHYLTKMTMDSVCTENYEKLKKEFEDLTNECESYEKKEVTQIYIEELLELKKMM